MIWKYLLDPLGIWLLDRESSQLLFFPSIALAAISPVLIAFRNDDRFAVNRLLARA